MSYYVRHLPHWQPHDAPLFITWRLHGSLPACVAGEGFAVVDRCLDQAAFGPTWLTDARIAEAVCETLHYGQQQLSLYDLRAWVIMSNHVHILIHPHELLARITRSVKNFSARRANEILIRTGQTFWQDESYDHWVRDRYEMEKIIAYIEGNPVAAGLESDPAAYRWSSASRTGLPGGPGPRTGQEACPTSEAR